MRGAGECAKCANEPLAELKRSAREGEGEGEARAWAWARARARARARA